MNVFHLQHRLICICFVRKAVFLVNTQIHITKWPAFYLCICKFLFVAQINPPRETLICATNWHLQMHKKKTMYYPLHASPTPPQPHNWPTFNFFFRKRGTPFFPDRPPRSSYQPRRVESKGAAGIPGQPITLRFVGYPTFAGRLCGWGAASIPPQRRWG